MPELPDVIVYVEALRRHVAGRTLIGIRVVGPALLRTWDPPIFAAAGKRVLAVDRLGKRIVLELEDDLFLILHLMIAGRLRWRDAGARIPGRVGQAAFDFDSGALILTEAGARKRASLHLVRGRDALAEHDPRGLDVLTADLASFAARVAAENHTLKRFLTSPRLLDGIGNAYSDEILHAAGLSPLQWTSRLSDGEIARLHTACGQILSEWTARLRRHVGEGFPEKVTAFRPGMAVHGRYLEPCPLCGVAIQRILYASRETNYCPGCQTGGQVYADRILSQLLKSDWPRTIEEWEQIRPVRAGPGISPTHADGPPIESDQ
jgi:formamidopyrimidine-DNA glycosylase